MKRLAWTVVLSLIITAAATAGKNAGGTLVVHADEAHQWYRSYCFNFEDWVPQECELLNTRTDRDENTPAYIWFIAAFDSLSNPGVTSIHFGIDHNIPVYYHNRWGECGPEGTVEHPDPGWPDDPTGAGNWVEFGSPVVNDRFFTFYRVEVWDFEGSYYGTGIHPGLGYASFSDDNDPPEVDEVWGFGRVRWYQPGYNICPGTDPQELAACCFGDGSCYHVTDSICMDLEGEILGPGTDCDPNPCPQGVLGVCCFVEGECRIETPLNCAALGGTHFSEELSCDPNPCPQPPEGACCLQTGDCLILDVFDCEGLEGIYLGADVACDPNPCFGACCFLSNDCEMLSAHNCYQAEGEFEGAGNDCDPNPCPQYDEGACCLETGACRYLTEPLCAELDAIFVTEATACDPNPCYGACCFHHGGCEMQALYFCEPMGGEFMGAGSDCDPNPCVNSGVPEMLIHESTWGTIKARYR